MAKQVVALEATLDSNQAEGSVKSLKAQLREAQAEVAAMSDKFGETSTQAAAAARKAAELKDRIGDAKALTDAFSPDKKFAAFAGALQGVVGGFTAVQGAMGLLGSESKDVEKLLLKVQSAMALTQGLNAITESIDNFKNLGTVLKSIPIFQKAITLAQYLWNAALSANPIGAIVTAVAALIAGIVALTKYLIDNSNANKQMTAEIEKSTKALKEQTKAYQKNSDELQRQQGYTLELAKAKGATADEIRKLEKKLMDEKIAHLENAREIAVNTFKTEQNTLAKYKAAGATDEVIKKQRELTKAALDEANKITEDLNKGYIDRKELQRKHNVQVAQEQTDANTKAKEKRQQAADETKKQQKKNNEDLLNANKEQNSLQRQLQEQLLLSQITDERKRADTKLIMDLENKKKEIENSKASTKEKNESIALLEQQYLVDLAAMKAKFAQEDKDKKAKEDADLIKSEQELNDIIDQLYQESLEEQKKISDEKVKVKEAEIQALQELDNTYFEAVGAGIGILKMFSEKNKGLQKAALIAENALTIAKIILDTQKANAAVTAKYAAIPGGQPIAAAEILTNKIKAGIGIATAIAATAKGLQGIGGGGSTGGAGSIGGGGNGGNNSVGASSPIQPQLSNTMLNQQAINQTGNAAVRAFVLETDVSGNQERIRRLNRAARIN